MAYTLLVITIFIFVSGFSVYPTKAEHRVELVHVLFRHGERTPREAELWPNDPYNASTYEPWGHGQLTNQGKMREYRIGEMLRARYDKFLGDIYYPSDVYAYSSDLDRTKMSLQLVLAALYQPASIQKWNKSLPWMPIPTHFMPEKVDNLMKPDFSRVYLRALKEIRESEEVQNKISVYKDLFKFLSEKTGANITQTNHVLEMYNMLTAQKSMNLVLPEWCTDEMYKNLQIIVKCEYTIRSYTPQLRRLNGGTLVKRFLDNMENNKKRDRPRKIYLYSGHETNIAGFARAHNVTEPELPNYGCAIIVEKLRDHAGKEFIRMLLWTGVTEELIPYKFAGCDEVCPIEKYLELVKDAIPLEEEWNNMWVYLSKKDLYNLFKEKIRSN
ncbi:venom acid phosphatase Acph-1-like isoform X2 [Hylaeus volcanicus]|uniref:venom acid phosphatase Acph-1-like isoform X2 n=1 Tax=Hylaeus volcanicus TaxID=313075 RepID=UPI0023B83575|nr:venom acid phosphatase Acph-1-like isoform X2 [Hylaeus volcanicus]